MNYNLKLMKMKKILLLSIVILFSGAMLAQNGEAPLSKGDKQLNFGLGFSSNGLPVYAGVDFAVHNDVTVGPMVKVNFDDNTSFSLLGRADYHFNRIIGIPNNWDFYAGGNIGFNVGNDFDLDWGLQVGGRWYWSDKWGLNLEFGGGTGFGTLIGVSMKF